MKPSKFIIVIGIVILLLFGVDLIWKEMQKQNDIPKSSEISEAEKAKIEAWIKENDLNQYGDPKGTFYTGGTPLFDEKTGRSIDKYEYILKNHSDRPWLQP